MLADLKRLLGLVSIAAILAVVINYLRTDSLGFIYSSPARQMVAPQNGIGTNPNAPLVTVVGIEQVIEALKDRTHLIVDARPYLFWEIGHIPGSVNLPSKKFDEYFPKMEFLLKEEVAAGRPLLLYCADLHCPDAGELAGKLNQRGFNGILLFEAGWAAWEASGQTVETK